MIRKNTLPHVGVSTRLAPSKIQGIGVFAIKRIRKGAVIFPEDYPPLVWVNKRRISKLPKRVKKLYEDFGVLKNGRFGCPSSFDLLTVAWYINHSKNPNVSCNPADNYNLIALRDIKVGEELTVDYTTYNDECHL